jgi:hypothetical protein
LCGFADGEEVAIPELRTQVVPTKPDYEFAHDGTTFGLAGSRPWRLHHR